MKIQLRSKLNTQTVHQQLVAFFKIKKIILEIALSLSLHIALFLCFCTSILCSDI